MTTGFVHLRVHSAYSLSEGALPIKKLIQLATADGQPAAAVTDSANLFGALEFTLYAGGDGLQPIIGCQLNLRRADAPPKPGLPTPPDQIVLLAQNSRGYDNLMELTSRAYLASDGAGPPQNEWSDLEALNEGLLCLTGGPGGPVGRPLAEGRRPAAEEALSQLQACFPGRLYVELMRHGLAVEDKIEDELVELAYARDLPLIATNDVYFANEAMHEAHDALLCIAGGVTLSVAERRRVTPEHRFKTAAEMRALFADLPEACDNTLIVAQRCAIGSPLRKPILPPFPGAEGGDEKAALRGMANRGMDARLATILPDIADPEERAALEKTYRDRLDFELGVIEKMGFCGYFLIVADFIQWTKSQGIPVGPGRGSGAGSAVAWALTITDLDPLRFGLLFERFLNPERVSMPDFDIDFCQDRRDEVIRYVQSKYGHDKVAQIITFGKLQARAALRDVGRVLEMPYGQIDKLCKLVPNNPAKPVTLEQAVAGEALLQQAIADDEAVKKLFDIAMKLEGLYRHASTHAAGVVIGDRPLSQLTPMYRDPRSDMPVTQFNMKYVEQAGLVKFDFLGLKTLTVLSTAVALIHKSGGEIDLDHIPLDDAKSYEMLSRGDAAGVFQLESSGMRDVLRKMKPDRIEDLIAVVALYRPGPMDNIPSYIARKHGTEEPDYLYPTLEPILKETYGIMIYQEQVMQIAQVLSGYSLGGADLLRRAMGKKIKEEMDKQKADFVDGAKKNGVDPAKSSSIFAQVEKFAGYGFNKSHAAAYAIVAYQTAYLKANWPEEFFAASMTLDLANTEKLAMFRQELARLRIPVLPPDINKSEAVFSVEKTPEGKKAVRYALAAVRNVGDQAMKNLVREREEKGPFKSLSDFATRVDNRSVNKRLLEQLISAGAFDGLHPQRGVVFAMAETIVRRAGGAAAERASSQTSLFGGQPAVDELKIPKVNDWIPTEKLQRELDAVGFYLSAHPLDDYVSALKRLHVTRAADLVARVSAGAKTLKVAGIVTGKQERISAKGSKFAFLQMSDQSGMFEITLFSEVLAVSRELLASGKPLLAAVEARLEGEGVRMTAQSLASLDAAAAEAASLLRIKLNGDTALAELRKIFNPDDPAMRGRGKVSLILDAEDREVEISLKGGWSLSPALRGRIAAINGVATAQEL